MFRSKRGSRRRRKQQKGLRRRGKRVRFLISVGGGRCPLVFEECLLSSLANNFKRAGICVHNVVFKVRKKESAEGTLTFERTAEGSFARTEGEEAPRGRGKLTCLSARRC
ncbi:MAG: hypothetical protein ACTS6G_06270 [Candidatus Hodgkinia cicadicola]